MYTILVGVLLGWLLCASINKLPFFKRLNTRTSLSRSRSRIIAHRCAGLDAPENTIAAAKKARSQEVDGIEVDLYLTKDSKAVLIHDPTLDRTTNGTGLVRSHTFSELSQLNAAHHFQGWDTHEKIPLASEVADYALEHGMFVFFDVKDASGATIAELTKLYAGRPELYSQSYICAFNYLFLYRMKLADPSVQVAPLFGGYTCTVELLEEIGVPIPRISGYVAHIIYRIWFYHVNRWLLYFPAVLVEHSEINEDYKTWWGDVEVVAWTVNDDATKRKLNHLSVSYITDII
jgi:glycerophosphoinositol glycerophosphodiesterase